MFAQLKFAPKAFRELKIRHHGNLGKRRLNVAALDWSQCPAVESIPGKVSGAWVFKDTRMPVSIVFENFESGASIDEIMDWFHLTREQIVAVLEFAARSLDPIPPPQQTPTPTVNARPV
jgi:uncharacterized protein (DUF433 family)